MNIEPNVQRMIDEEKELSEKLNYANASMVVGVLNKLTLGEQVILRNQAVLMQAYLDTLNQRIELAKRLA